MLTTAADLFRNLAIAWWQPVLAVAVVVIVVLAAWLLLTFPLAVAIGRAFKAGGEEFAAEEEDARADAEWGSYLDALGLTREDVRREWAEMKGSAS